MSWRAFPARALAFLSRGGALLDRVAKDTARTSALLKDSAKRDDGVHEELRRTRQELAELRREVRTRLLQNTLTVARAARALERAPGDGPSAEPATPDACPRTRCRWMPRTRRRRPGPPWTAAPRTPRGGSG